MTKYILFDINFQKNFLKKLSLGNPDILRINFVSVLINNNKARGKTEIR